jgi:hypothetical protein
LRRCRRHARALARRADGHRGGGEQSERQRRAAAEDGKTGSRSRRGVEPTIARIRRSSCDRRAIATDAASRNGGPDPANARSSRPRA